MGHNTFQQIPSSSVRSHGVMVAFMPWCWLLALPGNAVYLQLSYVMKKQTLILT